MSNTKTPDFGEIKVVRTGVRTGGGAPSSVMVAEPPALVETVRPELPVAVAAPRKPWIARFWWLPVLAVLGIGLAVWGRGYYQARYVGTDFYAQIPANFVISPVAELDMAGNIVETNGEPRMVVNYTVTGFDANGNHRELEFSVRADSSSLPQPGDFVRLTASQQLVLNQAVVPQSAVPAAVLSHLAG